MPGKDGRPSQAAEVNAPALLQISFGAIVGWRRLPLPDAARIRLETARGIRLRVFIPTKAEEARIGESVGVIGIAVGGKGRQAA